MQPEPAVLRPPELAELNLDEVAECLKLVAHPVRLRLIDTLLAEELTVGKLAARLRLAQPIVSGHLRRLQAHRLLGPDRRGKNVYYRVTNHVLVDLCHCIHRNFADCPRPEAATE